jgi:FtsP/CotA-like multicopper oxidase with cupredoxin domain
LILHRDRPTEITVVNRLAEPTSVHWHGMELESVYDGVAGWSRTGSRLAPLIAPGDSFTVRITPPRSGTFIYHSHMDETMQLRSGMYGALLVLEPGQAFEPDRDHLFIVAEIQEGDSAVLAINGRRTPSPISLRAGIDHRLRFINISGGETVDLALVADSASPLRWRPLASDGADLPPPLQTEQSARVRISTGRTYDVRWTPAPGEAGILVRLAADEPGPVVLRQPIRVR